ncbi:kelch-like protein 33 isoform X1 [Syngnathus typhle]|uniref:kelch-like protein 33 isoform X1 n=1 Tax=Syngnathus typhle TaxID=161592 RepID=UPI002A6B21FF|nr:kelch-like protein 33 isoform X1 [Syngnathus typhle]
MEASGSGLPVEWEEQWRKEKERRKQVLGEGREGVEQDKRELRNIVAFNDSRLGLTSEKAEPRGSKLREDGDDVRPYWSESFPGETFKVLREFLDSRLLTDLTLTTEDGSSFHVHSSILAAVSALIKARVKEEMLKGRQEDTAAHQWCLLLGPDVGHCGLRAVVDFAYTGELRMGDTLPQIEAAAHALGVPRLSELCERTAGAEAGPGRRRAISAEEEMRQTLRSVEQLWAEGVGCDVILDVNGAFFHGLYNRSGCELIFTVASARTELRLVAVHRTILAASSDYFRGMFTSGMRESRQSSVAIPCQVTPEMAALVCFCYRGSLPLNWDCVFELACTALRFQFRSAVSLCLLFMKQEMDAGSCLDVASFAEAYGMADLLEEANDYVLRHFSEVSATEKFLDLQAEKLLEFLCSDGLSVPSELIVFRALVSWVEADPEERLGHADKLMRGVRFPLMTFREFREVRAINLRMETKEVQLHVAAFKEFGSSFSMEDHCRVRRPKDSLVLVGGDRLDPDTGQRKPSDELWFVNSLRSGIGLVKDIEWRRLGHIPGKPKFRHGVARLNGRLFVVGGCHFYAKDDVMKSTYSYDPELDLWKRCTDMQERRSNFSMVVHRGHLCAIGGDKQLNTNLSSVEIYDPEADSWSFARPLHQPLSGHATTVFDGRVLVSGGFDPRYVCVASLFVYDPEVGSTHLADMLQNRAQHCMEALRGLLYVAGGMCNLRKYYTDQLTCELYDPSTDCWTCLAPLPVPHVGAASAILEENVYILGGYCQEDYSESGLVHRFNLVTQRWERMGKVPAAVTDIRACVLGLPRPLRC